MLGDRFADLHAALRTTNESADHLEAAASASSRAVYELVAAVRVWQSDGRTRTEPCDSGEW